MKTLKITLSALFISLLMVSFSVSSFAAQKNKVTNNFVKVQKLIDSEIDFPQEAKDLGISGIVNAQLQINADGKIEVEAINGNPELTKYVEQKLNNVTVNDLTLTGKVFIAKFDFRN